MSADKPTADRERIDIDSGKAGDKVAFPDPAAAPLGTDAEAGGTPPTQPELRMDEKSLSEPAPKRRPLSGPVIVYVAAAVVLILAILAIRALR